MEPSRGVLLAMWIAYVIGVIGFTLFGVAQVTVLGGDSPWGLLLAFLIGIVAAPILFRTTREQRRREALVRFASVQGFRFLDRRPATVPSEFSALPLFHRGEPVHIAAWLEGRWDGVPVVLLDYQYHMPEVAKHLRGGSRQTVVLFPAPPRRFPDFQLEPNVSALKRPVGEPADDLAAMGWTAVEVRADMAKAFHERYRLGGADPAAVAALFHPGVVEYLARARTMTVESAGGVVAVYRRTRHRGAGELPEFLDQAVALLRTLAGTR